MFKKLLVLVLLLPCVGGCIIPGRGHGGLGGHGGHRLIVPVLPVHPR